MSWFDFWEFRPFPFLFMFSVGWKSCQRKGFWLVIKRGLLHVSPALVSFLSFSCLWQSWMLFRYCLVKDLSIYFFCFLLILDWEFLFLFFLSIFDRELYFSFAFFQPLPGTFLFSLLLSKHIFSLTVNGSSFLGDPFVPSSEGKRKNSYPRSRFMANELRFWLKKLVESRAWCMSGISVR